jgi:uncharacterized protein (TIRG00374 family)
MESPLSKVFNGWRIILIIGIGLLISTWMLYNSISTSQYIKDGKNGTHEWVDGNHNNRVDATNELDFKPTKNGMYRELSFSESLRQIEWDSTTTIWLFIAFLFMVSRDFFYVVRIRLLTKNQLGWKAAIYVILLWEFASALTPGVVGGAAVAMFILNRETIPLGRATAIVIITAFMDNLFFVVMIPLVFLFVHNSDLFPVGEGSTLILSWWFWVGFGIIFCVCSFLYLTLFWYPSFATKALLFIFRLPFLKRWKFIAAEWGKDIEKAAITFKKEKSIFWLAVFASTFMSWISRYLVINAILNAFLRLGFYDNILVLGKQLILWLFMLVSPTPGGSGVAEYAFGELLSSFSSSAILMVIMAIIWRLLSYFPYLFIGAILLPSWIRRTRS